MGDQIVTIATAIVGVAILAVIVSNKANTANVVNAAGSTFANAISTAVSPVTGVQGAGTPSYSLAGYNSTFYNPGLTNLYH